MYTRGSEGSHSSDVRMTYEECLLLLLPLRHLNGLCFAVNNSLLLIVARVMVFLRVLLVSYNPHASEEYDGQDSRCECNTSGSGTSKAEITRWYDT